MGERLVVCNHCGSVNRLAAQRPAPAAKCGKCASKLFGDHPPDLNEAVLRRHIERTTIPVLVDVWAPWCGPCRMMAPAYEAAGRELAPDVMAVKLNSDENQALSAELRIRGIPTMILFHGGSEIARTSGAMSAGQIVRWVRDRLPSVVA